MLNRTTLAGVAMALVLVGTAFAQMPQPPAEKPPMKVDLKPVAPAPGGSLAGLTVAMEIQPLQPNVPAGLQAAIVITNGGTEAVEFLDPKDSSQLEIRSGDKTLRPAVAPPASLIHVQGAKPPAPIRLAARESRRMPLGVTDLQSDGKAPPAGSPSKSTTTPLSSGVYRVKARVRLIPAAGAPGEARPSPTFESDWVQVTLGPK